MVSDEKVIVGNKTYTKAQWVKDKFGLHEGVSVKDMELLCKALDWKQVTDRLD